MAKDRSSKPKPSHARPASAGSEPETPAPSFAERARTLVHLGRVGTLSSLSRRHPSWPFGSVMPFGLDAGRPTLLISTMAMHTQNLLADSRASLLVTEPDAASDPLGAGRVTLMGRVEKTPSSALDPVKRDYLARHPNASYWVDFQDFAFFRMEVTDVYFVGGFGVMGWVSAEEYRAARPDPLADSARGMIEHMNDDHADALLLLASGLAGLEGETARMTSVDRLGFQVVVTSEERVRGARIAFDREVRSPEEARAVLVEMVRKERVAAPHADSS